MRSAPASEAEDHTLSKLNYSMQDGQGLDFGDGEAACHESSKVVLTGNLVTGT
jgi:hypothetical protein